MAEGIGLLQDQCLRNVGTYFLLTNGGTTPEDAAAMINNNDAENIMELLDSLNFATELYLNMWKNNNRG